MAEPDIEPFRIATIALPEGGQLGIARLPGRSGDLDGDLAAIRTWPASLVLSMTEPAEMAEFGAAGLAEALKQAGITHRMFPIRDFGAPDLESESWADIARDLHARLDAGEAVLLHCRGGLGRSGMVAMRLVIERGIIPEEALRMVRAMRPGAVETAEQERWACAGKARITHSGEPG